MQSFPINWRAVLVAALVKIVLGAVWYSPIAFLPQWMTAVGISDAHMKRAFPKAIVVDIIGALVMAFVLTHAVHYAGAHTIGQGAAIGFFNWLGYIGLVTLGQVIYENRPTRYWLINNIYLLISLVVMGAVLAIWR